MKEQKRSLRGLSEAQVRESRALHGANTLGEPRGVSFLRRMLRELGDPIIRVLLLAVLLRVLISPWRVDWLEIGGILVAIAVSSGVGAASECGSERAFLRLKRAAAEARCTVVREGERLELPAEELVVGDIVLLTAGETVQADCLLLDGELSLELSALNGESREQVRTPGRFSGEYSLDDPHQVFAGGRITAGQGFAEVLRVGGSTLYGTLASDLQSETRESPLRRRLSALAGQISRIGYLAAALVFVCCLLRAFVLDAGFSPEAALFRLRDPVYALSAFSRAFTLAVTVIVVAVPEGLPMMITVVLSSNMKRMMRDRVLVKKPVGIETAGSMNLLFSDKTGTLTEGVLTPLSALLGDGESYPLPRLRRTCPRLSGELGDALSLSSECISVGGVPKGSNATDRALAALFGCDPKRPAVRRIPFTSERKYAAASDGGITVLRGAPEYLLPYAVSYLDASGEVRVLDAPCRARLCEALEASAERGERLVAVLRSEGWVEGGQIPSLTLIACITLGDRVRREVRDTIAEMRRAGVGVIMITGDRPDTARAIAERCGILSGERTLVYTASELAEMEDSAVAGLLPRLAVVARAVPSDKTRLVRVAQQSGLVVGMTGDGVNDAPALKLADVGFSMGSGTDVAKEASDVVLLDSGIGSISRTVLYGRTVFSSIRKFVTFQLMMNLCAVGVALLGELLGIGSPISVMQMLWVNLIMDTLGGLAFAGEPPLASQMREPPKRRDEGIVNRYMLTQILATGGFTLLLSALFLVHPRLRLVFGASLGESVHATAFFAFFIFAGLSNCFSARTERLWLPAHIGRNRPFLLILLLISVIQLLMIYTWGAVFGTVPLPPSLLLSVIGFALLVIPADLIRKLLCRLSARRGGF